MFVRRLSGCAEVSWHAVLVAVIVSSSFSPGLRMML
jgi:hypothetical protein